MCSLLKQVLNMLKKELGKAKAEMEKKMAKLPREMRAMLGGMGALALNELDASLDKSIKDMDEKEAANILKGFDKNKDGKVDKKEFVDNIQECLAQFIATKKVHQVEGGDGECKMQ